MNPDSLYSRIFLASSPLAIVVAMGNFVAPAYAQGATDDQAQASGAQAPDAAADVVSDGPAATEIVVTGTLLRGAAPVGSNLIGVDQQRVQSTGASTSNELLASIPQVTNYFNRVPATDLAASPSQIQVTRPNIRNISSRSAASSATLVLVDGHRIASAGVKQASVDPDAIPLGAIERVEVVTEGGSATYGADAVAGVINFITRKRFDGVKVDAHYGFADDYWQTDASITAGRDWGSGSAYVSYSFTKNDNLFGRDRDFIRRVSYTSQPYVPIGRQCSPANVTLPGAFNFQTFSFDPSITYAVQNLNTPGFNACDTSDDQAIVPSAERHGVVAGLYQEFDEATSVNVRAYYSTRETLRVRPMRGTVSITPANPYYRPIPSRPTATQTVDFSFAPVLGDKGEPSGTLTDIWGVNAEFTHKLGSDWQARALFNYSHSYSSFYEVAPNGVRLNAAGAASTTATAINPYDITATANRALITSIADNEYAGDAKDDLLNFRGIIDGSLLSIGGGDIRIAVGYEFIHESYKQRYQSDIRRGTLSTYPASSYGRDVHSVFGELNVPLFSDANSVGGIHSLTLSAQGRYDHYSDFGDTFNPKLGLTYKPVEWIALRGNWGTSFTAPTPLDQLGSLRNTLERFGFVAFARPGDALPGGSVVCCQTLALQGSRTNLQPQTAETWSVGIDVDPFPGLRASVSYYDVRFKDILTTPTPNVGIFTNFPDNVVANVAGLSLAQLNALRSLAPNANTTIDTAIADGRPVYEFVDFRTGNFGSLMVSGLDFSMNYRHDTSFGGVDIGINGNYQLKRKSQVSATSPEVNELLTDNPRLALQTIVGANVGALRAEATWNHTSGYNIVPTPTIPVQRRVKAFDTVNLFFKYDVPGDSVLLKDLSLTFNVTNVFDTDPPALFRNDEGDFGYANGFTFGRMFIIGVSKRF